MTFHDTTNPCCSGGALGRYERELLRSALARMSEHIVDGSNLQVIEAELVEGWKSLPVRVA